MSSRWLVALALAGCFSRPGLHDSDGGSSDDASPSDSFPLIDTTGDTMSIPVGACPAIYVPDLVAYYAFEDGSGNTARDGVQAALEGTIENAVFTIGPPPTNSGALNFESSDARVIIGSQPAVTDLPQISVCAWFHLAEQPEEISAIIFDKSLDGGAEGWNAYLNTEGTPKQSYMAFYTPYHAFKFGLTAIEVNEWHHGCTTWDGSPGSAGITVYVDGASDGVFKQTAGNPTRESDIGHALTIGRATRTAKPNYPLLGELDDVALYRRALTPAEVFAIFQCN